MCTVTFVPINENDFVITSNRDEAPNRISIPPDFYEVNHTKVLFPKDENSGGTWIGASEKNRVLCILNGGHTFHQRQESYRMSRGVVVKDLLVCENLKESIDDYDLKGIEPFTLVIIDWKVILNCYDLVWDGKNKYFRELPLKPKIWSSSTLFSQNMKKERELWFKKFKFENELTSSSLLKFHNTAGKGNFDYGVIMDRGFVKTTSITQIIKESKCVEMIYFDLIKASTESKTLTSLQIVNE